jgi:hypothetical protein
VRIIAPSIAIGPPGEIRARGGAGSPSSGGTPAGGGGGGGSGGAIELIAPTVSVDFLGDVDASGGLGGVTASAAEGGDGRAGVVRVIANDPVIDGTVTPAPVIERHSYTLDAATTGSGSGVVSSSPAGVACPPDCTELYDPGSSVTLSATPSGSSTFSGWAGGCSGISQCTLTLDQGRSASAAFAAPPTPETPSPPPPGPAPVDPGPTGTPKPDAAIRRAGGKLIGQDVYDPKAGRQTVVAKLEPGEKEKLEVQIANDGTVADALSVSAPRGSGGFQVKYLLGDENVTGDVVDGSLVLTGVAPGASRALTLKVRAAKKIAAGSRKSFLVSASSAARPELADAVRATLTVPKR